MAEEDGLVEIVENQRESSAPILRRTLIGPYRPRAVSIHRNINRRKFRESGKHTTDCLHTTSYFWRMTDEDLVNNIANKIKEEQNLAKEKRDKAEHFPLDALKSIPHNLSLKRRIKQCLSLNRRKQKNLSFWGQMKFNSRLCLRQFRSKLNNFSYTLQIWNGTMKSIEGEFGSAAASYFSFFRFLFCINSITFILCFFFIALPQMISSMNFGGNMQSPFTLTDIFTGQGYFTNSAMFYGAYSNATIQVIDNSSYSMPRGYIYTMIVIYLATLLVLAQRTAVAYRENFIETRSGLKTDFAHQIFCNWDFSIATESSARLKSSAIYLLLKELLIEETQTAKKSCVSELLLFLFRMLTHCMIIAIVLFIGYGMWKLFDYHIASNLNQLSGISTAIAVNIIMYIVPWLFAVISQYEEYKTPRKAFIITLIRSYFLAAFVVGALAGFWIYHTQTIICWETCLGQEIYRLFIFDFLFTFIFFILGRGFHLAVSYIKKSNTKLPEFEVATYTLHLIYNQAIFWFGLLYAPLLSAVNILKNVCIWYYMTKVVIKFCIPSTKIWRSPNTQCVSFLLAFVTMLLMIGALGGVVTRVKSSSCGPFRSYVYMYEFIINEFDNESLIWKLIRFSLKPGAIAMIIIALIALIYYLHAKASSQTKMIKVLREMIIMETKDKEFILKRIHKLDKDSKYYCDQLVQTEFQKNESTGIPNRHDKTTVIENKLIKRNKKDR